MAQINWYTQDLMLAVESATDDLLTRLALYVEGQFKVHARVDTGFYRNSAYATTPLAESSPGTWASGMYRNKGGKLVTRQAVSGSPPVAAHTAAVHVAAEYAVYREIKDGTLYRALEAARAVAPGLIQAVGREHLK